MANGFGDSQGTTSTKSPKFRGLLGSSISDSFACINTTLEEGCDIHASTNRRPQQA